MFAAIRFYRADPDSVDEVVRRTREGFAPLIKDAPGFVSYLVIAPVEREGEIVSVSVFEDEQSAQESNEKAEVWVRENLSGLVVPPELAAGQVVVYEAK